MVVCHLDTFSFLSSHPLQVSFDLLHEILSPAILFDQNLVFVCQNSLHVFVEKYSFVVSLFYLNLCLTI